MLLVCLRYQCLIKKIQQLDEVERPDTVVSKKNSKYLLYSTFKKVFATKKFIFK